MSSIRDALMCESGGPSSERIAKRMGAVLGTAVVMATLGAVAVAPAWAVNQTVSVSDNVFVPASVAVRPGESVTWNRPDVGNPHNVHFEDGALTTEITTGPFTVTRLFSAPGTYRYHCQIHGRPGGLGMSGVVNVNAAGVPPPAAAFTVAPNPARVGESVTFDGSGSSASGDSIVGYAWDLDGDGLFETDTGTTPTASRAYATPGTVSVRLRVTDGSAQTGEATRLLTVRAADITPIVLVPAEPVPPPPPPPPPPVPPPVPPLLPPIEPQAAVASFEASPKRLSVSRTGSFRYAFVTTAMRSGTIGLRSTRKVKVGLKKQFVKLADKTFKASAAGNVDVAFKLSNKNLAALKKAKRLAFVVAVKLSGKTYTANLTLKAPGKR